jgi:SAM-dependent methyltransferase
MNELVRKLARSSPRAKSVVSRWMAARRFHPVAESDIQLTAARLGGAWQGECIPLRQRKIVDEQLAAFRAGGSNLTYEAFVGLLVHNISHLEGKTLLEIGCSSGYHAEVLRLRNVNVSYRGCDYSPAFVQLAQQLYPLLPFDIENAVALTYASETFDIVVSGCCLLHIPQYEKAIAEAARVSKEFVMFHRTPVLHLTGTRAYTKEAYGTEMLEIHFHEQQLIRLFAASGLSIVDVNTQLSVSEPDSDERCFYKTYLCQKTHASS